MVTDSRVARRHQSEYDFLRCLRTADEQAALDRWEAELTATDPTHASDRAIHAPLWRSVSDEDKAAFDDELLAALRRHQAHWTSHRQDGRPRADDPLGHFNIHLTAVMAEAVERGLRITTSSDYTPRPLVNGDYLIDLDL